MLLNFEAGIFLLLLLDFWTQINVATKVEQMGQNAFEGEPLKYGIKLIALKWLLIENNFVLLDFLLCLKKKNLMRLHQM